ncbi:hypothetical protein ACQJBY_006942 [Aegilops geniculata]
MVPRAVLAAGSIPARTRRPPRLGLHGPTTLLLRGRFGLGSTLCSGRCPRRLSPPAVSPNCQCYRRALGTARRNPRATSSHSSSWRHFPPWYFSSRKSMPRGPGSRLVEDTECETICLKHDTSTLLIP